MRFGRSSSINCELSNLFFICSNSKMARGHQKIQSQAKAQEKASKIKKQQGHSASDQKKAAQKALGVGCVICKSQMPDPKTYKQHFENKHPKSEMPADLKDVV